MENKTNPTKKTTEPEAQPIINKSLEGSESIYIELSNGFKLSLCSAYTPVDSLSNLAIEVYNYFKNEKGKTNGSSYTG